MENLADLMQEARTAIAAAKTISTLEQIRVAFLGKKGHLTERLKVIGQLPEAERPLAGQQVNQIKQDLQAMLAAQGERIKNELKQSTQLQNTIDVTLPGRQTGIGSKHPVTQTRERMERLFSELGFSIIDGPEIEEDYYNFTALNIPEQHPSRAMHDTFYFSDGRLLRTHTSPVQIRYMQEHKPPLRIITTGRVYRRDSDLTHTPMFHQLEGLLVNETANFAELKGLLSQFLQAFFAADLKVRFRPSYFPFTEPSAEVDVQCVQCKGQGCRICKQTGWLEVLGCGMVHPNVLENVGINSERYSGFAFGMGIDRFAMLRYDIPDLRLLFDNDVRFLTQFC